MKTITVPFLLIVLAVEVLAAPIYDPFNIKGAHRLFMLYGWTVFIDIAVLLMSFKHKKWTPYLHGFLTLTLVVTTFVTSLPTLLTNRFNTKILRHYVIGVVIWGVMFSQLALGITSLVLQWLNKTKSLPVYAIKKAHNVLGLGLLILAKVQVYMYIGAERTQFWALLAVEFLAVGFYVGRFLLKNRLTSSIVPVGTKSNVTKISRLSELDSRQDCIFFANLIFDVTKLTKTHPGGYSIIQPVRGYQVDRYLYGMYRSLSQPSVPVHEHSAGSLQLLGKPIGRIDIPSAYSGFEEEEIVKVKCISARQISNNKYEVKLVKLQGFNFEFKGISRVQQLGRFYSLTTDVGKLQTLSINSNITRLYTAVYFLSGKSRELFKKIMGSNEIKNEQSRSVNFADDQTSNTINQSQLELANQDTVLPLLIKRYNQGKLTKQLPFSKDRSLRISCQRGFGLELTELLPGRVVVFVGGTGLYPFCDLIDLLFKAEILKTADSKLKAEILALYPVLKDNPFSKLSFEFFGSFEHIDDIHSITLTEIAYLTRHSSIFKFVTMLNQRPSDEIIKRYGLTLTDSRFQVLLSKQIERSGLSKVWVCGPPGMNCGLYNILSKDLQKSKFTFI